MGYSHNIPVKIVPVNNLTVLQSDSVIVASRVHMWVRLLVTTFSLRALCLEPSNTMMASQ